MDRPGLKLNVALKSRLGESPSDTAAVKQLKHADGPVGQGISSLINLNYPMSPDTRTSIFGLTPIELINDEEKDTPLIEG